MGISMNREEAIEALENGKKLTHQHFTKNEWVKISAEMYQFEDGCRCEPELFWKGRTGGTWESGWKEYGQ